MTVLAFTLLVGAGSLAAGFLGALTGLGGGVVIMPLLVLAFGVDAHYAIGASLIAVIATSSGAAAAYVREGYSNIRVGMLLEIATTTGAVVGAFLGAGVRAGVIAIIFGVVLIVLALLSGRRRLDKPDTGPPSRLAARLRLDSAYPTPEGPATYRVRRVPLGFALMFAAGVLSGLLGIGSGAFKVLAMDRVMRLPFKVSTTTSNFMIGVTAATSGGLYLNWGYIDPGLAMPVMLGALLGSLLGARLLAAAPTRILRIVFALVIVATGGEMIYKGISGGL